MVDTRLEQYAKLLVERSIGVEPGWTVEIVATVPARPLVEELVRHLARLGAFPFVRLSGHYERWPFEFLWAEEAPEQLLEELPPIERATRDSLDAWIGISAPENMLDGSDTSQERRSALAKAGRPFLQKRLALEIPWVV